MYWLLSLSLAPTPQGAKPGDPLSRNLPPPAFLPGGSVAADRARREAEAVTQRQEPAEVPAAGPMNPVSDHRKWQNDVEHSFAFSRATPAGQIPNEDATRLLWTGMDHDPRALQPPLEAGDEVGPDGLFAALADPARQKAANRAWVSQLQSW